MAYLILVRHGQSEWNALSKWTGWADVELSEEGKRQAREAAAALKDITLHKGHTSALKRAQQTLAEIKDELEAHHIETVEHEALNERNYGDYTGLNKWEFKEKHGEEEFTRVRRSWDHPLPGGESLKDVYARTVPYYEQHILEDLKAGKNVIVAAHGNSIRSLIKHLEEIPDDEVQHLELGTAGVYLYEIDAEGEVVSKQILSSGTKA